MTESQEQHDGRREADERRDEAAAAAQEQEQRVEKDLGELLAGVERERDEYLELARRTKADFENYRKRVAGEAREAASRGRAALARELLPVLDNLERALENTAGRQQADERAGAGAAAAGPEFEVFLQGVELVLGELRSVLERSGVESYEPAGEQFDPHLHEAMLTRPTSSEDAGKVVEVLEKGYRLDGQVLRPARVVVGAEQEPPANKPAGGAAEG